MSRQEVIDKFAREFSHAGFDASWSKVTLEQFAAELHEAGNPGVLPMDVVDDGPEGTGAITRFTCDSIAGGQHSTRGVPDFLQLAITWPTGVTERFRYTSELVPPLENPWPRFQPHPDDNTRCHVCGHTSDNHGTSVNHCPPFNLTEGGAEGRDEDTIKRARRFVARRIDQMISDNNESQADAILLSGFLIWDEIRYGQPRSSLLAGLAQGAGGALAQRLYGGIFAGGFGATREKHDDTPRRPTSPRKKPAPKKRATGRRGGARR
jgi:hypothetical protein